MANFYASYPFIGGGGGSGGVSSLNGLNGNVTLAGAGGITVSFASQTITLTGSGGTVTSVGLTAPSIFTVTGSPVTSSGTIDFSLNSQAQNLVFASPNGSSGSPVFRSLVASDIPSLSGTYLPLSGGTLTGTLTLNPSSQVGQNDAATIGQLAAFVSGQAWKSPAANAASLADINLAAPGASLDGYTFVTAGVDSFVAKNQTIASENGIYTWNGAAIPATRRTDADTSGKLTAATIEIESGTQNGTAWTQTTANPIIGTDPISFTDVGKIYLAGAGLALTGNAFSIATGGIVNAMVNAAAAIDYSKLNLTGGIVDSDVNAAAAIAGTKISPNFGSQNVMSTGTAAFKNLTITDTGGQGFIDLAPQSFAPAIPSTGVRIYSSFSNFLTISAAGSSGSGVLDFSTLTTARNYQFPNVSGIVGLVPTTGFVSSNGSVLTSSTTIPGTSLSGIVPMVNGGTGSSSIAAGFVKSNGTILSSVTAIDLTTDVTGILPIANGGTGQTTAFTAGRVIVAGTGQYTSFGTFTFSANQLTVGGSIRLNGTAGSSYIDLTAQGGVPLTVGSGAQIFSNISSQFSILSTTGSVASFNIAGLSANRGYVFQDFGHIIANVPSTGFVKSNGSTLSSQAAISLTADVSGVLPIANGGTNNSATYATKGVLFFDGTKITTDGTNFSYSSLTGNMAVNSISTSGTAGAGFISLVGQSSNPSTPPSGSIKIYSDNSGRFNFLNSGGIPISLDTSLLTNGRTQQFPDATGIFALVPSSGFVKSNGAILTSAASISLTTDISGILPTANGGTNSNSSASTGIAHVSSGTWTYSAVNLANADVTGILPSANGGALTASQGSVLLEDFLGNTINSVFGVAASGTAAGSTIVTPTALLGWRPGIGQFSTGSTAAGRANIGETVNSIAIGNNIASYVFETDIILPILSISTDRFFISAGMNNSTTVAVGTNFIGFTYIDNANSGAWLCTTSSASITTNTSSAVTVAANTWYKLTVTVNAAGTSVTFAVNGTTVATHTTNIPTGQILGPVTNIIKTVGLNARIFNIDYHKLAVTMVTPR